MRRGNSCTVALGDKEVQVHPEFRLYLATKLADPAYPPELSTLVSDTVLPSFARCLSPSSTFHIYQFQGGKSVVVVVCSRAWWR